MADIRITVATPAFGEMFYTPYVQSLLQLQRAVNKRGWTMSHASSYALVADAAIISSPAGTTRPMPRICCSSMPTWASSRSSSST